MENFSMKELLEQSSIKIPRVGGVVKGKVVMVNNDSVIVNIGYKSDGILPMQEISNNDIVLSDMYKPEDEIEAVVLKKDNGEGNVLLSVKRINIRKDWDEIENLFKDGQNLVVKVAAVVKGGLTAYYNEIRAFIPASQIDVGFTKNLEKYVGQEFETKFIDFNRKKNQIVLSRKALLERELNEKKDEFWGALELGMTVSGVVRRFTPYGAFIELGQADGLLHVSEISWGKVNSPEKSLKVNEEMEFKIIEFDRKKEKISLSLKQLSPDPWTIVDEKYQADNKYSGKVVSLTDFGAFVELEPGLEGLVHVSQISEERVEKPSDKLTIGDVVEVSVIEIDKTEKKIKLSMK